MGYTLRWTEKGLQLRDRKGRIIPVDTSEGCPQVARSKAITMIQEIEDHLCVGKRAGVALAKADDKFAGLDSAQLLRNLREKVLAGEDASEVFRQWISRMFPEVPEDIVDMVVANPTVDGEESPWNRRQRRAMLTAKSGLFVNLFAGSTRGKFQGVAQRHGMHLIDLDVHENLLQSGTFGYLAAMALIGRIRALLGGPPCRTYSPCRLLPNGPPVARTRKGPER